MSCVMGRVGRAARRGRTSVDDLQTLITRRLDWLERKRGDNAADVLRRAAKAGYPISKGTLSRHANGDFKGRVPSLRVLRALEAGLDLSLEELGDAALRSTGVPMPDRKYRRESDKATVRGLCAECTARLDEFDELCIRVRKPNLTDREIAALERAVQKTVTRTLERPTQADR